MITKNIGGDRLGSGNKMNVTMHGFERSNHDMSFLWKTTMSPGTLVPFMNILTLPGDTFDIKLNAMAKTLPTIGPLFGSFKIQLDVFHCPIRLYHKALHNNRLGVGLEIENIKLPQMHITSNTLTDSSNVPWEFQQINQSSLIAYLGIRGLGQTSERDFCAVPYLAFWDIYKNYYANKQEDNAYYIHATPPHVTKASIYGDELPATGNTIQILGVGLDPKVMTVSIDGVLSPLLQAFQNYRLTNGGTQLDVFNPVTPDQTYNYVAFNGDYLYTSGQPSLRAFPLENIDTLKDDILSAPITEPFVIDENTIEPFGYPIKRIDTEENRINSIWNQEGLPVKTYQSDVFNNWIKTETQQTIATISAISTAAGSFTIDTLNLSKKIYDMLNRVAMSGGSYQDWLEANWDHTSKWRAESPVYHGGLSKELVFTEVVSTAATNDEPLGSLSGKGVMTDKHKGGDIIINVDEPGYIIGIVSITPRLDYSQGNDWTVNLKTLDDLHKPMLDGIGFQDLITDTMFFADTYYSVAPAGNVFRSAGKQPAWINYMTNFNKAYGHFADPRNQMFMTLNRRYEMKNETWAKTIKDLTTYIDPAKFNYAFAQTDTSAMNFWMQIACDIQARRKMSAKIIPNL